MALRSSHPDQISREINRCRDNLAAGGSAAFWVTRLHYGALTHEQAATKLRSEIASICEVCTLCDKAIIPVECNIFIREACSCEGLVAKPRRAPVLSDVERHGEWCEDCGHTNGCGCDQPEAVDE